MFSKKSKNKAFIVTLFLSAVGALGFWLISSDINDINQSLPLLIFYIILTINTFYSIRCFDTITPKDRFDQKIIDALLITFYLLLVLNFSNAKIFIFISCLIFALATIKYTLLLSQTDYLGILRRKIYIDSLGTIACLLALGGILAGYQNTSSWLWAIIFLIANIQVIILKPLYLIPKK